MALSLSTVWEPGHSSQCRRTWCGSKSSFTHWAVRLNIDIKLTLEVQMSVVKLTGDLVASSSLCTWHETHLKNSEKYHLLGLRCLIRFTKPLSCTTLNSWSSSAINIIFLLVALEFSVLMSKIGPTCGCCGSAASLLLAAVSSLYLLSKHRCFFSKRRIKFAVPNVLGVYPPWLTFWLASITKNVFWVVLALNKSKSATCFLLESSAQV